MKLKQWFLVASTLLVSTLAAVQAAHAAEVSVDFPVGQKRGTFNCTFDGPGQVNISTDHIKVRGFCAGDPGVTTPGHWQGSGDDIKGYYFSIVKSNTVAGKVTISSGDIASLNCSSDTGGKAPYPHGSKYCDIKGNTSS